MQACEHAGAPMPELRYEQTGLRVIFPFSVDGADIEPEKSSEKILTMIKAEPHISARNMAEKPGLTPGAVEKQIAPLKAGKHLKRFGPAKGGHWEVFEWKSCLKDKRMAISPGLYEQIVTKAIKKGRIGPDWVRRIGDGPSKPIEIKE